LQPDISLSPAFDLPALWPTRCEQLISKLSEKSITVALWQKRFFVNERLASREAYDDASKGGRANAGCEMRTTVEGRLRPGATKQADNIHQREEAALDAGLLLSQHQ
jgi:hypothetical protein